MKLPEYLGPYRIGELLGKGGMGAVYKAEHAKSGDTVAVKLIALQISDEMRFRRRFDAEIKTLKCLSHPNIVKLVGFGEEHDLLFYSMEYVDGQSLQDKIRAEKKIHWTQALDIAIQVCSALKHAHDIGVIHRDLKPANLLIKGDGTVKLVDFGISKLFGNNLTAAGSIMGTADYMAPEQATEGGTTIRSDLYSLGCVIYAMLCGRPPFRGKNITEVIEAVKHKDHVPLDMVDPELPDDIVQLVNELLQKSPADRPPTALAVMNRLKAMRSGLQRMATMADTPSTGQPSSDAPMSDTRVSEPPESKTNHTDPAKTVARDDKTRPDDTVQFNSDDFASKGTEATWVNPSAKTLRSDQDAGGKTIPSTTPPSAAAGAVASGHSVDFSLADPPGLDTSIGTESKTHFQTVSDSEGQGGTYRETHPSEEHFSARYLSIGLIVIALAVGGYILLTQLGHPSPDDLITKIEAISDDESLELKNELERFVKLYPEHPQADFFRDRLMVYQVNAAVKRLKLRAKLRTDEGPLYETSFLQAMDLRDSDPSEARKQLQHWIDVFQESAQADQTQRELGQLAAFEIERLDAATKDSSLRRDDPKLAELSDRIDEAEKLAPEEQRRLLEGILNLYHGQTWAEPALERARELLKQSS